MNAMAVFNAMLVRGTLASFVSQASPSPTGGSGLSGCWSGRNQLQVCIPKLNAKGRNVCRLIVRADAKIMFDQKSRSAVQAGIDKLSDAVGVTVGPRGFSNIFEDDGHPFEVEEEELTTYVPPPSIAIADLDMNRKAEDVLYTLKDALSGSAKVEVAKDKYLAAWKVLKDAVEVQDPLICIRGTKRLHSWVKYLANAGVVVDLHEIYIESCTEHRFKRWVGAVWTLKLTHDLERSLFELGLFDWWLEQYVALSRELHFGNKQQDSDIAGAGNEEISSVRLLSHQSILEVNQEVSSLRKQLSGTILKLSGESKFEIDKSGQVVCIQSSWYITRDQGKELFEIAKLWLVGLLYKEAKEDPS